MKRSGNAANGVTREMKITIRKIAELAGVSRGTVDKVVHDRAGVSDEVRAQVQKVIDESGYKLPTRKPKEIIQQVEPETELSCGSAFRPRLTNPFFEKSHSRHAGCIDRAKVRSQSMQSIFIATVKNVNEQLSILYYLEEQRH